MTCFFGSMSFCIYGQPSNDSTDLEQVVFTGGVSPVSATKSVFKVSSITADQIRRMGALNLQEALTQHLNIRLQNDPVLGSSLNLQGMSGQNVKILMDGIPLTGRNNGQIDLSQINLQDVKKIEIIEGPMSVLYGADAMGGVINLISGVNHQCKKYIELSYQQENLFGFNQRISSGFSEGKHALHATISRNFFGGYAPNWSWDTRVHTFKPKIQIPLDFRYIYQSNRSRHIVQFNGVREFMPSYGSPVVSPIRIYAMDDDFITRRFQVSLTHEMSIGKRWKAVLQESFSGYHRLRNAYIKDLVSGERKSIAEQTDTARFGLAMLRGFFQYQGKGRWVHQWGYDVQHEEGRAGRIIDNVGITDAALFMMSDWALTSTLTLRGGIRKSYNSRFESPWLPNLQMRWEMSKKWQFRAAFGTGFRAPALKEMYLFFVDQNHNIYGNPELKPEFGKHASFSLNHCIRDGQRVFQSELSYAYNKIDDLISLALVDAVTQTYKYINAGNFNSMNLGLKVSARTKKVQVQLGYALNARQSPQFHDMVNQEWQGSFQYFLPWKNMSISGFMRHYGVQNGFSVNENGNLERIRTQAYTMADMSVNAKFFKQKWQWTAGIKNIFGVGNVATIPNGGAHQNSGSMFMGMGRVVFVQTICKISS